MSLGPSQLRSFSARTMLSKGTLATGASCDGLHRTYSAPALYEAGQTTTALAAMNSLNGINSRACSVRFDGGQPIDAPFAVPRLFGAPQGFIGFGSATNVVTNGATAWFLTQSTTQGSSRVRVRLNLNGTAPLAEPFITDSSQAISQALLGPDGGFVAGTSNSVFVNERRHNFGVGVELGWPVIASQTEGFIGGRSALYAFDPSSTSGSSVIAASTDAGFATSPILGSNGEGYAISKDGVLHVFAHSPFAAGGWSARINENPLRNFGAVVAHPAFACAQSRNRPGTLLVGAANSTQVTAILVDAPKLADTPWPKYQRSLGNAGNTSIPVNWPSCP
jgi:hypothetical protein